MQFSRLQSYFILVMMLGMVFVLPQAFALEVTNNSDKDLLNNDLDNSTQREIPKRSSFETYRAFEGQIIFNRFYFGWDEILNSNNNYAQCDGRGTINIFFNGIPDDGNINFGIFASGGYVYAYENAPETVSGWSGSDKWKKFNGDYTGSLTEYRIFVFSHELSHNFGIPDQYYCETPPQRTLFTKSTEYRDKIVATFSHRRTNMPDDCFINGPPTGYVSDWDKWIEHFPTLYHFETSSSMFPSPSYFYVIYSQS